MVKEANLPKRAHPCPHVRGDHACPYCKGTLKAHISAIHLKIKRSRGAK